VSSNNSWDPGPPNVPFVANNSDRSTSDKAAILLGLLFPLVGYPVGIIFMMLDDPRKSQIGRLTILWSTIGLVITFVLSIALTAPLIAMGSKLLPSGGNSIPHSLSGDGL
jgi:hypothetical protein